MKSNLTSNTIQDNTIQSNTIKKILFIFFILQINNNNSSHLKMLYFEIVFSFVLNCTVSIKCNLLKSILEKKNIVFVYYIIFTL